MGSDNLTAPVFTEKADLYMWLTQQAEHLILNPIGKFTPQANLVIGLANLAGLYFYELNRFADAQAVLQELPVNWFGFYLVQGPGVLALGPFQGRPACATIYFDKGVCGKAAATRESQLVSDVHAFPGHIACDASSRSEVVVPILSAHGAVLGLIDVDSTRVGHFDSADQTGLEALAAVLSCRLEFPMARALAANPALEPAPVVIEAAGGTLTSISTTTPTPTAIITPTGTPPKPIAHIAVPAKPTVVRKEVGGWVFETARLDRISGQASLKELTHALSISAFPEILFPGNRFTAMLVTNSNNNNNNNNGQLPSTTPAIRLVFELEAVLRDAAAFYHTAYYRERIQTQTLLPVSEAWALAPFNRYDPGVDWGWRHRYYGVPPHQLRPLTPEMPDIDWSLLRNSALPILFFDALDLFEDDLHDFGLVHCSVKFRVMTTAFFVLFRHFIRLDRHEIWFRDVRIFHKFDAHRLEHGVSVPHVVVVEQFAKLAIRDQEDCQWRELNADQAFQKATVMEEHKYYIDPTTSDEVAEVQET